MISMEFNVVQYNSISSMISMEFDEICVRRTIELIELREAN